MSSKLHLYTKAKQSHDNCFEALLDALETNDKIEQELSEAVAIIGRLSVRPLTIDMRYVRDFLAKQKGEG